MKAYRPVMPPLEELPIGTPGEAEGPEAGGKAWRCRMCGHVHYGNAPPEECPYCFYPKTAFKPVGGG
jgi:acyl-CoA dehydrogenase